MAKKKRTELPGPSPDEAADLIGPPAPMVAPKEEADSEPDIYGPPAPTENITPPAPESPSVPPPEIVTSPEPAPPSPEPELVARPLVAPVAAIAVSLPDPGLEDRLHKMEQRLAELLELERRITASKPAEIPSILSGAMSLLKAGTYLVPGLAPKSNRLSPPMELLAELRAMQRMFVDPRYTMSWLGRIAPLLLLLAFLFPTFWVPGASVAAWLVNPIGQLLAAFVLFKVLTTEARRYRETAPDLPPSLRLERRPDE